VKSLIKKIAQSDKGIYLRNSIGFRPVKIMIDKSIRFQTISDAFLWRTDNGFKTTFNYGKEKFNLICYKYVDIFINKYHLN